MRTRGGQTHCEDEVGVTAGKFEKLSEFYVSPGFLTEKMYVYLATEITETEQRLENDELIEIERIPLAQAAQMARDGRIPDAKTIIGLLIAERMTDALTSSPTLENS